MTETLTTASHTQRTSQKKNIQKNQAEEHMEAASLDEAGMQKLKEIQALFREMKVPFAKESAKKSRSKRLRA